jgi:hypothetical protein
MPECITGDTSLKDQTPREEQMPTRRTRYLWLPVIHGLRAVARIRAFFAGASAPPPTFAEWLAMSDDERARAEQGWNPYAGEGFELVSEIGRDLGAKCADLAGLEIDGPGVYHGGYWVIAVRHPFVFDRRRLPAEHLGIAVHGMYSDALPPEFAEGTKIHDYVWAPPHYEQFVDRASDEIRLALGDPAMSREDVLAALVGMPFAEYVEKTARLWRGSAG